MGENFKSFLLQCKGLSVELCFCLLAGLGKIRKITRITKKQAAGLGQAVAERYAFWVIQSGSERRWRYQDVPEEDIRCDPPSNVRTYLIGSNRFSNPRPNKYAGPGGYGNENSTKNIGSYETVSSHQAQNGSPQQSLPRSSSCTNLTSRCDSIWRTPCIRILASAMISLIKWLQQLRRLSAYVSILTSTMRVPV
ncbi:uncharacterized protein LOC109400136 [Aedes albopictus]|uniref:Secreted protein n=1 Tax=Aedes albopictus TaxID=7160 RepID=A0ABM2A2D6_AEDAL